MGRDGVIESVIARAIVVEGTGSVVFGGACPSFVPALFGMLQRCETILAKYGKRLLGLAGIKKLVGRDRLTNLLNS
jgi:hypothetical protein